MMKKRLGIILLLFINLYGYSQDPQFSQFYAAPLYLGPSLAGTAGNSRVCLNYRDQWPKLSGKFLTYSLSYDTYLSQYNSGVGLLLLRDDAGSGKLTTTQAGLNYSYRVKAGKDFFIQPGIQFMYYQRKIDFEKLTFADQYYNDQVLPQSIESPPGNQNGHIDFTTSLMAFNKNFWFGSTLDHMMRMNTSLQEDTRYVPLKLSVYGGVKTVINEAFMNVDEQSVSVAFNYRTQAMLQQLDLGVYYNRHPFTVGLWYRGIPVIKSTKTKDAISILGGLNIKDVAVSYSYDLTVSKLVSSTGGAHEISIIYYFDQYFNGKSKHRITGAVPCPRF
ncbi:MAG: PorP/SprF family type IX secretion system membrane protein [Bacteroidota bacterium]|nr:PorP/SprF family type IX secretion system membrane protein [Bacteroidota bacterium]MDP4227103.1 PorP/SprF family type IX secretion system membrane protein [Bacteroidota bacterium]MDP4275343.1 PorP/SprF family type IX secretion system membrane protein [Bacteroidota bacterium]